MPANEHGFLLENGTFTEIQAPGYLGTIVQRITPTGEMYGCTHDLDYGTNMRGFLRFADGTWSVIGVPSSMSNGATPDGSFIAGRYNDLAKGLTHGFIISNGAFESFDVPDSNLTAAYDANPLKQVVGYFRGTAGKFHGFLLSGGQFTTLDYRAQPIPRLAGSILRGILLGSTLTRKARRTVSCALPMTVGISEEKSLQEYWRGGPGLRDAARPRNEGRPRFLPRHG